MSTTVNPYLIRCPDCRTRNRIPAARFGGNARCGKCQATIRTGEVLIEQPLLVTDANFQEKILGSPIPALIFAWAPWCPSCGQIAPQFDAFAQESRGRVRAGKLNVDANPVLAQQFNILSVPFMFVFDSGQLRQSLPGGMMKHDMMMLMASYI